MGNINTSVCCERQRRCFTACFKGYFVDGCMISVDARIFNERHGESFGVAASQCVSLCQNSSTVCMNAHSPLIDLLNRQGV